MNDIEKSQRKYMKNFVLPNNMLSEFGKNIYSLKAGYPHNSFLNKYSPNKNNNNSYRNGNYPQNESKKKIRNKSIGPKYNISNSNHSNSSHYKLKESPIPFNKNNNKNGIHSSYLDGYTNILNNNSSRKNTKNKLFSEGRRISNKSNISSIPKRKNSNNFEQNNSNSNNIISNKKLNNMIFKSALYTQQHKNLKSKEESLPEINYHKRPPSSSNKKSNKSKNINQKDNYNESNNSNNNDIISTINDNNSINNNNNGIKNNNNINDNNTINDKNTINDNGNRIKNNNNINDNNIINDKITTNDNNNRIKNNNNINYNNTINDKITINDNNIINNTNASLLTQEKKYRLSNSNFSTINNIVSSLKGLQNLGNTCFMNTCLQNLIHCKPLIKGLINNKEEVQKKRISNSFLHLCLNISNSQRAFSPNEFRNTFTSKHIQYANYGQHDTVELLRTLLDDISKELNKNKIIPKYYELKTENKSKKQQNDEYHEWYLSREDSIITSIFYAQIINTFTCECGYESYSFEKILDIPLLLPNNRNLNNLNLGNLLSIYFSGEKFKWSSKCEKCNKKDLYHQKSILFAKLPKILIFSIQRYNYFSFGKSNKSIEFYDEIDLINFIDKELVLSQNTKYQLFGISNHSGTLDFGHYYSYTKVNDNWYEFNDSYVSKKNISYNSTNVYALFYEQI